MDGKVAVRTLHALDRLVLADVERVVLSDLAVVFEGLASVGLLVGAGEGHVADLEQLGRGEEGHVRGILEERVAKAALVDEDRGEARALRLDSARHPRRPGADHQQVVSRFVHASIVWICMDRGGREGDRRKPGSVKEAGRRKLEGGRGYLRSEERRVGKECRSRWSPY